MEADGTICSDSDTHERARAHQQHQEQQQVSRDGKRRQESACGEPGAAVRWRLLPASAKEGDLLAKWQVAQWSVTACVLHIINGDGGKRGGGSSTVSGDVDCDSSR